MQDLDSTKPAVSVKNGSRPNNRSLADPRIKPARDLSKRKRLPREVAPDPGTTLDAPLTDRELAAL